MQDHDKLAVDESRKVHQHEEVKEQVREDIHRKIKKSADQTDRKDQARVEQAAEGLKEKAFREIRETEGDLERTRAVSRASQFITYLFYLIYGLIGMEILLELLGARESNSFKQFVDTLSAPVLAPFRGLLFDPGVGPFRLMLSYLFALFFYFLLHLAIKGLLRLFTKREAA